MIVTIACVNLNLVMLNVNTSSVSRLIYSNTTQLLLHHKLHTHNQMVNQMENRQLAGDVLLAVLTIGYTKLN